ncbi:MAG TPA: hypothetical protein DCY75_06035 [Clostridiales bacterium]|nr:hypothetical protein [Clostridiales bacterium]
MICRLLTQAKQYISENKRTLLLFAFLALFLSGAVLFTYFDAFLYDCPVGEVIEVKTEKTGIYHSPIGDEEGHALQTLTLRLINGNNKGKFILCENECTDSGVYDETYRPGDRLLLEIQNGAYTITGLKRDTVAALVFAVLLFAIVAVSRLKGVMTLLSVAVNGMLFSYALDAYLFHGVNIMISALCVSIIFCVICILIVCGWNKKAFASILSTLVSVLIVTVLTFVTIWGCDFEGVFAEGLQYLIIEADYRFTFLAMLLLGSLGAMMDICVSMAAGLQELIEKDHGIARASLNKSGIAIGKDMMGTMVNVLLFTYLCGSIPYIILVYHNGMTLDYSIISLEMVRFLCGGCGIMASVFFSRWICIRLLRGRDQS